MNRRALSAEQRRDIVANVDKALDHIRAAMSAAPDCGALLVVAYRTLSTLREMHETVDGLPVIAEEKGNDRLL